MNKGFTLIELVVVITIIVILSGIILFSVTQYINTGKDSNISGNLAVLVPAGEVFYNANNNSYEGFCVTSVVSNAVSQMPPGTVFHCFSDDSANNYQDWAACAQEFTNTNNAYCVDSRGVKEEMLNCFCTSSITQCPDPTNNTCPS